MGDGSALSGQGRVPRPFHEPPFWWDQAPGIPSPRTRSCMGSTPRAQRLAAIELSVPEPVRSVLRGVGQVFFQENAITGACFVIGILLSSPIMGLGALVGAAIGTVTARLLKYDSTEVSAGIYGFNGRLVGIATFFYFQPDFSSILLLLVGCVLAAFLTRALRRYLPFPTYTSPFVLTAWLLYFVGPLGRTGWALAILSRAATSRWPWPMASARLCFRPTW